MQRMDIVWAARKWVGTPFHHQARTLGHGVDCAQLVLAVAIDVGAITDPGPEWQNYGRVPRPEMMGGRIRQVLHEIPKAKAGPGDIVWVWWRRGVPMHLGVLSEYGIIHAFAEAGCVVETLLKPPISDKIQSYWRFPGLEV